MKIAISGAASTGKTTLSKIISKKLHYPLVGEYAREYMQKKYGSIFDMDMEEYHDTQWYILREKIKRENSLKNFVSDRCMVDALVYYLHLFSNRDTQARRYWNIIKSHAKIYDMVFVINFDPKTFQADEFRNPHIYHHRLFQATLIGLLKEFRVPHVMVIGNSIESKRDEILHWIKKGRNGKDYLSYY